MADRELAGEAVDQVEADGQRDVDADEIDHPRVVRIDLEAAEAVFEYLIQSGEQRDAAADQDQFAGGGHARLDLLRHRRAHDAGGAQEQNQDEDGERHRVAVGGVRRRADPGLHQADQDTADHGAGDVADAAEHRGDERLQPGHQAHQRVDSRDRQRHHHATGGRQGGPEREGEGDDEVGVDAHQLGHGEVVRRGAHRFADLRPVHDELESEHHYDGDDDDQQALVGDLDAADGVDLRPDHLREEAGCGAEYHLPAVLEQQRDADGGDQRRQA